MRRLVILAGHDRACDGSGGSVPVATHGYAHDWRDAVYLDGGNGQRYQIEPPNTPDGSWRNHYLVVEVIDDERDVLVSSITGERRRGLLCRVIKSHLWPSSPQPDYPVSPDLIEVMAANRSSLPPLIERHEPALIVTRSVAAWEPARG